MSEFIVIQGRFNNHLTAEVVDDAGADLDFRVMVITDAGNVLVVGGGVTELVAGDWAS